MDRNPHEIVTLDDHEACPCGCGRFNRKSPPPHQGQRYEDGEGYELGRAYGGEPMIFGTGWWERCEDAAWDALNDHLELQQRKPMRIRYMELPGEINPNTNELTTPFVIVIDRVTGGDISEMLGNAIALNTGARGVLAFEQEIQIGDD